MKTTAPKTNQPLWQVFAIFALLFSGLLSASQAQVNSDEQALFNLMKNNGGQHRVGMVLNPLLCKVARAKALDMANRNYFAHIDPSGHGANYLVRQAGYVLPAEGYSTSPSANNIESLAAGRASAGEVFNAFIGESAHRAHILGENAFWASQNHVGVGFVSVPGSTYQYYTCVITCPPSGPQLVVSSPKASAVVTDEAATVTGTTDGLPAAASVQVRLEPDGAWVAATGTTSWSANVNGLVPGMNTVRVQSLNASGDVLRSVLRGFRYVVTKPVTVNVSGNGTVTKGFAGTTTRELGRAYTIAATPKAGSIFAGWTGAVTSLSSTITFTVGEETTLTASFIPNPFTAGVGGYSGLFTSAEGQHGSVRVSLASNGVFTGRLDVGSEVVVIKGRFDATGAAQITVKGKSGAAYTLALNYTNNGGVISMGGTVSGEGWSADLSLDALSKPSTTSKNAFTGRYTMVIPATDSANAPVGDGAAIITVAATGATTVAGSLADGTPFTFKGRVTSHGMLQIFAPLYARGGVLTGTLTFRTSEVSDLDGAIFWSRPASETAPVFASGFTVETTAVGSRYIAPAVNQTVVPVSTSTDNTALALGDGGLTETLVQPATLSTTNVLKVTTPAVAGFKVSLNAKSGRFAGKFTHPATGVTTTFRGVILQKQAAGFGSFNGGTEAGFATFAPAETQAQLAAPLAQ